MCLLCSFMATNIMPVKHEADIETVLKVQLGLTTLVLTPVIYALAAISPPSSFDLARVNGVDVISFTPVKAWACVVSGLWSGCLIGFITEYYTSHSYAPVREVAQSCETGAATNIIYGLALGYRSAILPVSLLAIVVYISFWLGDMYGVALAALGMLANLSTCLAIDVYGPICDNAGGIAEMSELPENVRDVTDALDAAGNTTAAIGKGFAIGSACLVGLALFGAFVGWASVRRTSAWSTSPGCIFGAMIPYWFSAMTMKSVGQAANEMVKEVARQFREIPGLLEGTPGHAPPDYARCIRHLQGRRSSLSEMVPPAIFGDDHPPGVRRLPRRRRRRGHARGRDRRLHPDGHLVLQHRRRLGQRQEVRREGPGDGGRRPARAPTSTRRLSSATPSAIPSRTPPAPR